MSSDVSDIPAEAKSPNSAGLPSSTESLRPSSSTSPDGEAAAVQPVIGISQRVHTGPKKKKDLGTTGMLVPSAFFHMHFIFSSCPTCVFVCLGLVLGILMMAIIIVLGAGITFGYFYKRY